LYFEKLLLKKVANINTKNEKVETAKEFAVQYNHPEMTSILK
jgi:hypothetical protein